MKLLFLASVLLVSIGNISSLDSFVGRPGYCDLTDGAILDDLRQLHPTYARSGSNPEIIKQIFLINLKILVSRNIVPYPQLAPNVAYVPDVGTNCINYGDVSVFVNVPAARITAVVPQSHCISLQCELPQQNEKLDRIIYGIAYSTYINLILSQLPNLGAKVLQSGYGVKSGPLGPLGPHDSLREVGALGLHASVKPVEPLVAHDSLRPIGPLGSIDSLKPIGPVGAHDSLRKVGAFGLHDSLKPDRPIGPFGAHDSVSAVGPLGPLDSLKPVGQIRAHDSLRSIGPLIIGPWNQ